MKKDILVSIGIPAYNEERNIAYLLNSLCTQKEYGFKLKEIIIASDGSSDNTVECVRKIKDKRITIIASKKRKGKAYRMNQIFKTFTGDVLFTIDADILIRDPHLLAKIIKGADFKKDGIISVNTIPLLAHSLFEKIIAISIFIIRDIARDWNNGRNYLAFRGCFLGFDGEFARTIHLPEDLVNDDAYLYLFARQKGYHSNCIRSATIFFRSPTTFTDHKMQSSRYQESQHELSKYFAGNMIDIYKAPLWLVLKNTLRYFFLYPFEVVSYMGVRILTKMLHQKELSSRWAIAKSTKILLLHEIFLS